MCRINDLEALVSRKVVFREGCTEVSGTTNVCIDPSLRSGQDPMNRIRGMNAWMSKHIFVKSSEYQKRIYVDPAGIDGKLFALPREIS